MKFITLFLLTGFGANAANVCDAYLTNNSIVDQNGYFRFRAGTTETYVSYDTGFDVQIFIDDWNVNDGGYLGLYETLIRGVHDDSMPNDIYFLRSTTELPDNVHGGWGRPLGQAYVDYGFGLITIAMNCGLPKQFNYSIELYQYGRWCGSRVGFFNSPRELPECFRIYDMDEDGDTDMDDYQIFHSWEPKSLLDFAEFQLEFFE